MIQGHNYFFLFVCNFLMYVFIHNLLMLSEQKNNEKKKKKQIIEFFFQKIFLCQINIGICSLEKFTINILRKLTISWYQHQL